MQAQTITINLMNFNNTYIVLADTMNTFLQLELPKFISFFIKLLAFILFFIALLFLMLIQFIVYCRSCFNVFTSINIFLFLITLHKILETQQHK